jgi:hypothetical protein
MSKVGDTLLFYTNSHAEAIPVATSSDMPTMQPQHAMTAAGKARLCVAIKKYFVTRTFNHSHLNLALNQHLGVRIPRRQPIHLAEVLREKVSQ